MQVKSLLALSLLGLALCPLPRGSAREVSPWIAKFNSEFAIHTDVPYRTIGNRTLTLDLFLRNQPSGLRPVVFYIHGGAWAHGSTVSEFGYILPWLEMGWSLVSVEYRLASEARAPAAVEDCFCALHWLGENAPKYSFDLNRLVISGASAGGNLALLVAMAPPSAGLDPGCPGPLPRAAAIVNIAGVSDVAEILPGTRNGRQFTADWIGSRDNFALARRVSPLSYVRPGLPPVLTIHGDSDPVVPYDSAVRLHQALDKAGVPNEFLTIRGGGHGGWKPEDYVHLYDTLEKFLAKHGLEVR